MADMTKIFVNGKEVDPSSLDNLPQTVRDVLVDANKNGVPDILENIWQHPLVQKAVARAGEKAGTVYTSFDQLPAEMREPIQKFMVKMNGGTGPMISTDSSSSAIPPAQPVHWKALEQPEGPKSISIKVVVLVVAVLLALLLAGWIFLLALRNP
jgi:hypothetical protein